MDHGAVRGAARMRTGTVRYELHKRAKASLGAGKQLQESVRLPPGEDINEWLAVHGPLFAVRRTRAQPVASGPDPAPCMCARPPACVCVCVVRVCVLVCLHACVCVSRGLFQPDQPHLRHAERRLHGQVVPTDDGRAKVTPRAAAAVAVLSTPANPRAPRRRCLCRYEYFWKDEHNPKYKSATTVSTPEYVDLLMTWIEGQINNETIFPPDVSTSCRPRELMERERVG